MAHVAELPGCFAGGSTAPQAVGAVPMAIVGFLQGLKRHREPLVPEAHVSRPSMADLSVAEVRSGGAPTIAGSKAALFEFDRALWDDYKLERTLRWLGYSRADLLAKIDGLDDATFKAVHIAPDRTLWNTLWHIANAEYGYITRLTGPLGGVEPVTDDEPSDVRARLAIIREILLKHIRAIPAEKRAEVILPTWSNSRPDELWTMPKVLRRALEHELEHLREL